MSYLGKNAQGEEVHASPTGCRKIIRDGKVISWLSTVPEFNPYSDMSDNRFKTVPEIIEGICRHHESGIDGIGVVAAIRAMAQHWKSHLDENHPTSIIVEDLTDMKMKIDGILDEITVTLGLPPIKR